VVDLFWAAVEASAQVKDLETITGRLSMVRAYDPSWCGDKEPCAKQTARACWRRCQAAVELVAAHSSPCSPPRPPLKHTPVSPVTLHHPSETLIHPSETLIHSCETLTHSAKPLYVLQVAFFVAISRRGPDRLRDLQFPRPARPAGELQGWGWSQPSGEAPLQWRCEGSAV